MKPLVRWTIGAVSNLGFLSLEKSIQSLRNIYGNRLDYILCHNNLDTKCYEMVSSLGVRLIEQKPCLDMFEPLGVAWKLYPPRLRLDSHELFIDNDLIILNPIKEIDDFLSSADSFLYSECRLDRPYGAYEPEVPLGFRMNTGLFGLPPGFDFEGEIKKSMVASQNNEWTLGFDEQGMVASIFADQEHLIKISLDDIFICGPKLSEDEFCFGRNGYHFVSLNSGFNKYWVMFNQGRML